MTTCMMQIGLHEGEIIGAGEWQLTASYLLNWDMQFMLAALILLGSYEYQMTRT